MTISRKDMNALAAMIKDIRLNSLDLEEGEQSVANDTLDLVETGLVRHFMDAVPQFRLSRWYDATDVSVQEANDWVAERERKDAEAREEYRKTAPAQFDRSGIPLDSGRPQPYPSSTDHSYAEQSHFYARMFDEGEV